MESKENNRQRYGNNTVRDESRLRSECEERKSVRSQISRGVLTAFDLCTLAEIYVGEQDLSITRICDLQTSKHVLITKGILSIGRSPRNDRDISASPSARSLGIHLMQNLSSQIQSRGNVNPRELCLAQPRNSVSRKGELSIRCGKPGNGKLSIEYHELMNVQTLFRVPKFFRSH